jgi:hypothetical protein
LNKYFGEVRQADKGCVGIASSRGTRFFATSLMNGNGGNFLEKVSPAPSFKNFPRIARKNQNAESFWERCGKHFFQKGFSANKSPRK